MTAPIIPGPGQDIGAALGNIVGLIRKIVDPGREERDRVEQFFLANPEIGQQFAAAQREQVRAFETSPDIAKAGVSVPPPNVLQPFGFDVGQTEQVLGAFPENEAERLGNLRRQAGIERFTVEAELAVLREKAETSKLGARLALARSAEGVPELTASREAIEETLGAELNENQLNYLGQWNKYLEELKVSNPFEFNRALIAMSSPEFLRDIQFREELALRRSALEIEQDIAALGDQPTSIELFKLNLDAQNNLDTQLDRWREALESGSEEEKAIALQRINEAAALVRAISPVGAQFAVDPGKRGFLTGRLRGFRVTRLAPGTLSVPLAVQYERLLGVFEAADPSTPFAELRVQLTQDPQGAAFLGALSPREIAKFWADAQAQLGGLAGVTVLGEDEEEADEAQTSTEIFSRDIGRAIAAAGRFGARLSALSRGRGFRTRAEQITAIQEEITNIEGSETLSSEDQASLNRLKLELRRLENLGTR